jgi:acetyl esterase/lipase
MKFLLIKTYSQMQSNIFLFVLLSNSLIGRGQSNLEVPLYQNKIPNSINCAIVEKTILVKGTRRISDVTDPTLTIFTPNNPNGTAIIICPGGGYARLSFDHEGVEIAKELNLQGITAFVLKYRLPNDTIMVDKSIGPLQDLQQAIRLVRHQSSSLGLKENKIGIMGFSAGGHLAATAATHFNFFADSTIHDTTSVRPDFAILIYPVISFDDGIMHKGSRNNLVGSKPSLEKINFFSNELQITKNTPPIFIIHAGDDHTVPVENSIRFYQACIKNNVPVEMHLYPNGGHGFGLYNATTTDKWIDRLGNWLNGLVL